MKLFKFITSKNFLPIVVVLFFGIIASRTLLFQSGYFNMHDDLQIMRQLEMEKCFFDGQIPCRWVPDMGYGFGFPLFNFYPPLPYIVGELFRLFGFSFITTAKLLFATSILASGVFMYLFAKEFFGRIGGVVSAVFYIWAPYHAVDVYVRGAMNESWALIFFPAIFYCGYKLITENKGSEKKDTWIGMIRNDLKWIILLALSYFGLLTSHNLMLMIFTPVFGVWVLFQLWQNNAWRKIPSLLISGVWAFGLSAFFTFPAIFENKFTQLTSQLTGYYDYTGHFVSIRQLLFSRFWGYGASVWLEEDGMSFQIGEVVWGLSLVAGLLLLAKVVHMLKTSGAGKPSLVKQIQLDKILLTSAFLLAVGWFSAFMTHSRSIWFWKNIPQVSYMQFPWRFLALVIFAFSFVIGSIIGVINDWSSHKKWYARLSTAYVQFFIAAILSFSLVFYSWTYFLPEKGRMGKLTDQEKLSGAAWDLQRTAGIYDYLPKTAKRAPTSPQTVLAEVVEGEGAITGSDQGTYWGLFNTTVDSDTALIRINIFDFPGWKVFIDDKEVTQFIPNEEEWGRMYIVVPQGSHRIYTQIINTPVRTVSNLLSFMAWGVLVGIVLTVKPFKKANT